MKDTFESERRYGKYYCSHKYLSKIILVLLIIINNLWLKLDLFFTAAFIVLKIKQICLKFDESEKESFNAVQCSDKEQSKVYHTTYWRLRIAN